VINNNNNNKDYTYNYIGVGTTTFPKKKLIQKYLSDHTDYFFLFSAGQKKRSHDH